MKPALPVTSQRNGRALSRSRVLSIAVIAARVSKPPYGNALAGKVADAELALHVDQNAFRLEALEIVEHRTCLECPVRNSSNDRGSLREALPGNKLDPVFMQRLGGRGDGIVN